MTFIDASILGIVEGITEFLPVSSTGHMILVSALLRLKETEFLKTFEIAIQFGAIIAIVLLYAKNIFYKKDFFLKIIVAFIPTGIIGFFAYKAIKAYLFNSTVVAIALILGGIILVLIDKKTARVKEKEGIQLEHISYSKAVVIGLCQSVSMIPGVSRATATIIGGMWNGLSKKHAMEFSFLLAIPTMVAATGYDLLKSSAYIALSDIRYLIWGACVSFAVAWIAVKILVRYVEQNGFAVFGYYRIIIGILFLFFIH
jgi:undecaprenyl-diphosphatase